MADGQATHPRSRGARRARHPRHPAAAPRRATCPASSTAATDCVAVQGRTRRVLRAVLVGGSALIDLEGRGGKARPVIIKDQQHHPVRGAGACTSTCSRSASTRRSRRRRDRRARGRRGGARRQGGRRARAGAPASSTSRRCRPTSPTRIIVDVSAHGDRRHDAPAPRSARPQGVDFLDDLEETIIATITVPTEVGGAGDRGGDRARRRGRRAGRGAEAEAEAGAEGATGDEAASRARLPQRAAAKAPEPLPARRGRGDGEAGSTG